MRCCCSATGPLGRAGPRHLPEEHRVQSALAVVFDAVVSTLSDTRLEPDLDELLWSTVNLFHRASPFKRIDQLLQALPIGVAVLLGSGITDNLAGKARGDATGLFMFCASMAGVLG